jgi:hypothetical protein
MSHVKQRKVLWFSLRIIFAGIVLLFLARTISSRWTEVKAFEWQLRPLPLLGSLFFQMMAAILWASTWWHMLLRSGCCINWLDGIRIYVFSNLAKYIPGSIWGYVSRIYLGQEQGLTTVDVGISAVWEVGISIVSSLLLTATVIPAFPARIPDAVFQLVFGVAILCLMALTPPIFSRWVHLLERWLPSKSPPSFRWSDFFLYLVSAFIAHVLVGTGFYYFVRSLVDVDPSVWWSLVGMWSFAATAGLVIVLVPYGLGVKEGLLAIFLQVFVPIESATPISLASRLWTIACELLIAGLVALLLPVVRRKLP